MKYKLHPLFILYLIFLLIMGQFEGVLIYILVVSLHEFAHSYTARKAAAETKIFFSSRPSFPARSGNQ